MFSMDVAVRAQLLKAWLKASPTRVPVVLNIFAGNELKLEQNDQASFRRVAEAKLSAGNEVRPVQNCHVSVKPVPRPVLTNGKEVRA